MSQSVRDVRERESQAGFLFEAAELRRVKESKSPDPVKVVAAAVEGLHRREGSAQALRGCFGAAGADEGVRLEKQLLKVLHPNLQVFRKDGSTEEDSWNVQQAE